MIARFSTKPGVPELSPDRAFIFRITHIETVAHLLEHGVLSRGSEVHNPRFVNIGDPELISKRQRWRVNVPPGGTLSDYVPFYFTPHSPMAGNIRYGTGGAIKRPNEEIVILITSLHGLLDDGARFIFTNQHACSVGCKFFTDVGQLGRIDWEILRARDFKRDMDDPRKFERYMAEALVHEAAPIGSIRAIACFSEKACARVKTHVDDRRLGLRVVCRPGWYFA